MNAPNTDRECPMRWSRREILALGAGAAAAAGLGAHYLRESDERGQRARVFIAKATSYREDLTRLVREGLSALGLGPEWVRGRTVLLKPNLVEPSMAAPHINTHPAVIVAVAEVFHGWHAREVLVAEGQGHCRDSDWVLEQSGLGHALAQAKLSYVDLNHDEVDCVANAFGATRLKQLFLPRTITRRADLVVSLAKLKTHHWAGVTLSMKNLFGVLPGICYGWPKNVLHQAGIPGSILDITATVRPALAIVDGIVGMEGDGPVMGAPRACNALVMGTSLPAVDATATRLLGLDPTCVGYLAEAAGRLGPIAERHIIQRGEPIAALAQQFNLPDFPAFAGLRRNRAATRG